MNPSEGAKILFTGPTGVGKSTAIRALSEPAAAPDGDTGADTDTFDYGEFRPDGAAPLRLYGAPEQTRFDFTWKVLADEAMGLVVLLDHHRPDPAADALRYLQSFDALARRGVCVVGVGRFDAARAPSLRAISSRLEIAGYRVSVVEIDVRCKADLLHMMRSFGAPQCSEPVTPQPPAAGPTSPLPLSN